MRREARKWNRKRALKMGPNEFNAIELPPCCPIVDLRPQFHQGGRRRDRSTRNMSWTLLVKTAAAPGTHRGKSDLVTFVEAPSRVGWCNSASEVFTQYP